MLCTGRLLTGHSAGSNLVSSPIFVSEISHPDIRGTSSVLTMVLYTSGFFVSMLAGAALNWRIATGLFIITGVLSFVLLLFCKVIYYCKFNIYLCRFNFRNHQHGYSEKNQRKRLLMLYSFTEGTMMSAGKVAFYKLNNYILIFKSSLIVKF